MKKQYRVEGAYYEVRLRHIAMVGSKAFPSTYANCIVQFRNVGKNGAAYYLTHNSDCWVAGGGYRQRPYPSWDAKMFRPLTDTEVAARLLRGEL